MSSIDKEKQAQESAGIKEFMGWSRLQLERALVEAVDLVRTAPQTRERDAFLTELRSNQWRGK